MSGLGPVFVAGKPISAAALEDVRLKADLVGTQPFGLAGAGILLSQESALVRIPVWVTQRAVGDAAALSAHSYTVTDGIEQWPIDYQRLIVPVEPALIDDASPPMGFWPAEVAGQGLGVTQPWRAWGELLRGPGGTANTQDYAVLLYGLVPARGC